MAEVELVHTGLALEAGHLVKRGERGGAPTARHALGQIRSVSLVTQVAPLDVVLAVALLGAALAAPFLIPDRGVGGLAGGALAVLGVLGALSVRKPFVEVELYHGVTRYVLADPLPEAAAFVEVVRARLPAALVAPPGP